MKRADVPKPLQERLGADATEAFVDVLDSHQVQMGNDILARIDARTARLEERLDSIGAKYGSLADALERGFGTLRADMADQRAEILKWMFLFWVGQAFAVLAYSRALDYLAAR